MMNQQDFEVATGWRPVFKSVPCTKSMAQKVVIPQGIFYSPFIAQVEELKKGKYPLCSICRAAISSHSKKDKTMGKWICVFCGTDNPFQSGFGNATVEEGYEGKAGDCGLYLIIDTCVSSQQLQSIKTTLIETIEKLPLEIFVGLIVFNQNVMMADFTGSEVSFLCLNGQENYPDLPKIIDPQSAIINKYYVPLKTNKKKLLVAISEIDEDSYYTVRQNREKRCTGAALQIAVNSICSVGINTRFISIIGGPCTIGPGRVVDLPRKKTIRVYMDILEGNENAEFLKPATKFYETLSKKIIENKCTMDIWAYGLDQFGLLEMRDMVNCSGGLLAMHQQFEHFIFKESFKRFYEPNELGMLNFPFACQLRIRVSKQMKINGILGTCKSLKENTIKSAAQMEIGEGGTNEWYVGGISSNNALCILLSHGDIASSENKQTTFYIQAITTYKYSDNILRTKVSNMSMEYIREVQMKQVIRGFDEEGATVMIARMASKKAEVEEVSEVKKWVDRMLLKFIVRFAHYNRGNPSSFRLPNQIKQFPQLMYHLRRSSLINPFGSPPDQSIYMKTCLLRESLANCIVMIQSALIKYSSDSVNEEGVIEPVSVELDFQQMKEDAVLLMDSYFTVIVWYGEHIQGWKDQKLNEDPEYEYLTELFEAPIRDAGEIMYDRLPISNFYETFKNDGKQRYLKARVNPSTSGKLEESDGHFISEDAPINLFMQFLVRSVVNYIQ